MTIQSNRLLAISLATAGCHPFPCKAADKKPLVPWRELHTPDHWLGQWQREPDAMPGIECGRHGLLVIDCDVGRGENGIGNFIGLCDATCVNLSGVPLVTTPSGGRHYYFRQAGAADSPLGHGNTTGELPLGIDVRGHGGYVIAPGAISATGACYSELDPAAILAAPIVPTALLATLKGSKDASRVPAPAPAVASLVGVLPAFAAPNSLALAAVNGPMLNSELMGGLHERWTLTAACTRIANAREGHRNTTLNREALISWRKINAGLLDPEEAKDALIEAAKAVGLDNDEIRKTLSSAQAGAARPMPRAQGAMATALPWGPSLVPQATLAPKASLRSRTQTAFEMMRVDARLNEHSKRVYLENQPGAKTLRAQDCGVLTDGAVEHMRMNCNLQFNFDPTADNMLSAVQYAASFNIYHPPRDWLDSLKWDGMKRIETWLADYAGAEATELNQHAGIRLLMSICARIRYPGTKADVMFVLEGTQGSGKSSLAKALAQAFPGESPNSPPGSGCCYFTESTGLIGKASKELGELINGKIIAEIAELSGLSKRDVETVKSAISVTQDEYRPAYGRTTVTQPRSCIFIGTTNSRRWLEDTTGNRRFLPIAVGKANLVGLRADLPQLYAEADAKLRAVIACEIVKAPALATKIVISSPLPDAVATCLELPKQLWGDAAEQAEARRHIGLVEQVIEVLLADATWLAKVQVPLPTGEIFISSTDLVLAVNIAPLMQKSFTTNMREVATHIERAGWDGCRAYVNGKQLRGYKKPPP